jgi:hypothetical protein
MSRNISSTLSYLRGRSILLHRLLDVLDLLLHRLLDVLDLLLGSLDVLCLRLRYHILHLGLRLLLLDVLSLLLLLDRHVLILHGSLHWLGALRHDILHRLQVSSTATHYCLRRPQK